MSEPLDPLAAGVALVLKSLRARAGLQEERLASVDLALDTLTGLESVREHIAAGDTVEQAIVRAVAAATGALPPTYSIVADVSLGLKLSADLMPESDLYSGDLGRRRAALLENWDRLHEMRSAAVTGPAPTPRALRLELETEALSALATALTAPERQTVAEPEPSPRRGTRHSGRGDRSGAARSAESPGPGTSSRSRDLGPKQTGQDTDTVAAPRLVRARASLLLEEFRRISRALRASRALDAVGNGWPQDLRKGSRPPTVLSTSFGLKAMLLLEGHLTPDLIPVAEWLKDSTSPWRKKGTSLEGYAARTQDVARPEATAAVLSTLHRLDGTTKLDDELAALKNNLDSFDRTRPFILTNLLETSIQLGSDSGLTTSLIEDLLGARRPYGNFLLWPEKAEKDLVAPAPSIAHTARAVRALALAQAVDGPDGEVGDAVSQAAAWLAEQQELRNVSEVIDRQVAGRVELVYVRHYTAAWVVKALVSAGLPTSHPSVSSAVARIWTDYSSNVALWRWPNGELPVWMTLDAVDALRLAAMAVTIPAGGFDEP
jgi:hypothetical protein